MSTAHPGTPAASVDVHSGKPLSRRGLLRAGIGAAGLATAAPLLTGCDSSGDRVGGKARVRVWTWYTYQSHQWPQLIEEFEHHHPSIKIENRLFGGTNSYLPALQAAVAGGNPPEVFAPHVLALEYGKAGISADLRKELGSDFIADFFDSINQEYADSGKQYAVGWMAQTFGIFYNPQILSAAGVQPPETWDDLLAASKAVKSKTGKLPCILSNNPGTNGIDFFWPLIAQVADDPGYVLKLDRLEGGVQWTDPSVVHALELVDRLVRGGAFQDGVNATQTTQAEQLFYTGRAAMLFMGSWVPQDIQQNASPSFAHSYRVAQTPALKSGGRHWCANQAGAGLAVSETSPNKEAALEFLRFLYQRDRYTGVMNASFGMPSTKAAAERVSDPTLKEMTSWLIAGNGAPHIPFGRGSAGTADPLAALIGGQMSPRKAAEAMQQTVERARR
ncbi:extracellular solute-binding protein [Streptomyces sp. NPDC051322]|uniref:ABC transporter substrate-binding protein n=1 Tax=Streptomyces sp. NPDC051322 TaxID=3154645 RepID=UPI00345004B1